MTLKQQASLCSGKNDWETEAYEDLGIPAVVMSDGPNGMRVEKPREGFNAADSYPSTCFPTAGLSACSWNPALISEMASAIAKEAKKLGVDLILGPGLNIKRSPLCGRNFEYYSEDPLLSGQLASAFVKGAASEAVGCTLKHFVANNQETRRMTVDAHIDERTLREIYLKGFEIAVKNSHPMAVMSAYNAVNGAFMSQNKALVTDVLRKEWGFDGIVMTDWNGVYNRIKGVKAGVDLEMPGSGGVGDQQVACAIQNGTLRKSSLNALVERNIDFALTAAKHREQWEESSGEVDYEAQHALARRIAEESIVLLKNEENLLPITKEKFQKVAIIGKMAFDPRIQGAGSSKINEISIDTPYESLTKALESVIEIVSSQGYSDSDAERNECLMAEAQALAAHTDVVLLFVGLPAQWESEGYDRRDMALPKNQQDLITAISQVNPHTVLIYMNGGALDLAEGDAAQAIIEAWMGGESIGSALSGILTGKVNPSGHLAESIPFRLQDTGCYDSFPGDENTAVYGEGIFVGYRHYDHVDCPVRYPFGFGLSYTTFEYTDLDIQHLGDNTFRISCQVKNTGAMKGKTVVQVYTGQRTPKIMRPIRELRTFKKVALNPGEQVTLEFELGEDAFTYYNTQEKKWCTEGGLHTIEVGESSRGLPLASDVEITRNYIPTITKYSYLGDILDHPKGPQVFEVITRELEQLTGENVMDLQGFAKTMFYSTPICKLTTASHGLIAPHTIALLIEYLNNGDLTDTFTMERLKVGDEAAGGTSKGLIAGIFDWVGKIIKGNVATVYSVEDKMSVLLNNPDTRAVLARYCPEDILDGEQLRVAARMGLTLRRIQKLVPQDIFPERLLEEINANLKEIKKEI